MKPLFLLLTSIIIFSYCNKDVDKSFPEINKLSATTQTGGNKTGCLVNGIAFLPIGNFLRESSLL